MYVGTQLLLLLVVVIGSLVSSGINVVSCTSSSFNYTQPTTKIYGVALGGWLVLEPYITPSLFEAAGNLSGTTPVDEYHLGEVLHEYNQTDLLRDHWETFIDESDFEEIANLGLNLVRIPVGYWAFGLLKNDTSTYIQGQADYLDQAIEWATDNDLKVWIDLHGVPGSQNGFDNSGLRDLINWQKTQENLNLTRKVINDIFDRYSNNTDTVIGIEIVNEPFGSKLSMTKLKNYYRQSFLDLSYRNNIVLHDAFQSIGYWSDFIEEPYSNMTNISMTPYSILDHHHYEVFSNSQLNYSIYDHVSSVVDYGKSIASKEDSINTIVGEWSAALTDCVYWLNGVGRGARYDGSWENEYAVGSCDEVLNSTTGWSEEYQNDTRLFIEAQIYSYENNTDGWIFWTWKTETSTDWDLQKLVELDLFPQPLDNFTFDIDQYLEENEDNDDDDDDDETVQFTSSSGSMSGLNFDNLTIFNIIGILIIQLLSI